jgi:hypothetical protein
VIYAADFEEARRAYGPPPNDSKKDAFKAWGQVAARRPAQDLLLAAIGEYQAWLEAENIKRVRLRQAEHPKCHMATWLRQERWEGFLEAAQVRLQRTAALTRPVPQDDPTGFWGRLTQELGPEKVAAWFGGAVYDAESPSIAVAGAFKADWVGREFRFALHRAAGGRDVTVTVLPKDRTSPEVPWHQRS